jgi:hypothetical protein
MPTLYACVYRRHIPSAAEWRRTVEKSSDDRRLARFLDEYWREDRYYDWGDDPAFFGARAAFNDARRASWGVCRRDVRSAVKVGDAVAFFIGKPAFVVGARGRHTPTGTVDYLYVGCGTVGQLVDRRELWEDEALAAYRDFYNALARPTVDGKLENIEVFPRHENWQDRAAAPLVLFDPTTSWFDLDTPHRVARYEPALGVPERWEVDPISQRLERLLFGDGRPRRLRTSHTGYGHAKRVLRLGDDEFRSVRDELVEIARAGEPATARGPSG